MNASLSFEIHPRVAFLPISNITSSLSHFFEKIIAGFTVIFTHLNNNIRLDLFLLFVYFMDYKYLNHIGVNTLMKRQSDKNKKGG